LSPLDVYKRVFASSYCNEKRGYSLMITLFKETFEKLANLNKQITSLYLNVQTR